MGQGRSILKKAFYSFLIFIFVLAIAALILAFPFRYHDNSNKNSSIELYVSAKTSNWMSKLNDNLNISQITLPGTHDSGTEYVIRPTIAQTQDNSISEQLKNGIRYLDIRLSTGDFAKKNREKIYISHYILPTYYLDAGKYKLNSFSHTMSCISEFLKENPTETVIIVLKKEYSDYEDQELEDLLNESLPEEVRSFIYPNTILNPNPKLSQVRGKMIIYKRYLPTTNKIHGLPIKWDEQKDVKKPELAKDCSNDILNLHIQDFYKLSIDNKIDALTKNLVNKEIDFSNTVLINFASTVGPALFGVPRIIAKRTNKVIENYKFTSKSNGIVVMDFPSQTAINNLINANFVTESE